MKELLNRIFRYKTKMTGIIFMRVIASAATLLMPYIMSEIVNNGISNGDMNYILRDGVIMLLLALAAMGASICTTYLNTEVTAGFTASLQKDMFQKVMKMSFDNYSTIGTSSLITRCNEDVFTMQELIGQITYVLISFPVLFFGGVFLTMLKDAKTGLIMLLVSPLILIIVGLITSTMGKLWRNSDRYIDMQNKVVRERLSGLRVIRAFDKEDYEHGRIDYATRQMAHNIIKANVLGGVVTPLCTGLLNIVTVLFLLFGARELETNSYLTAGDIIASVQYIALIANGLLVLSWSIVFLPHVKVSLNRINEVLQMETTAIEESEGKVTDGDFRMEHLTFCYPGAETPAISDISISAKKGETVAIIGGTGSGKSTVTKLLMRFYKPTSGEIYLGNKPYSQISKETIRDNISVALQKSMIFEGTIGSNIRLGYEGASEEEMKQVCGIAQIYDFVESHKEGFDYGLTQAGANISGGQKQRINIARTIIKPASIYLFDDSFSALDYLTERNLRRALNLYLDGKTQLIITQRAATAMRCDKIYVMENGSIAGCGTHGELMANCGIYKEIYQSQLGGEADEK